MGAQKIGLKYFDFIQERIPREQVGKIGGIVEKVLQQMDDKIVMDICGSYRRGRRDCGDIDILISHPDAKYEKREQSKQLMADIVSKFRNIHECGLKFVEDLALGPAVYRGICRIGGIEKEEEQIKHQVIPKTFKMFVPSFDQDDEEDEDGDDQMITLDNPDNDNNHNRNDCKDLDIYCSCLYVLL